MSYTIRRAQVITDRVVENDLIVLNIGDKPTFHRNYYTLNIGITLATANMAKKVSGWEMSERESLSDHNYNVFEIAENQVPTRNEIGG